MKHTKRGRDYSLPDREFEELKKQVTKAGCFESSYLSHFIIFLIIANGLAFSAFIIMQTDTIWIQIVNAIFAGFLTVQLGLIGHDLSHNGVFVRSRINQAFSFLIWSIGCGLSESRWFHKHNQHHISPNHIEHDPDVRIPFVFSHEQAQMRSDFAKKYLLPKQHILFWIGLWFVYISNMVFSMRHLFSRFDSRAALELLLIGIHFALVIKFTFWFLPTFVASIFNLVVIFTIGIYMATIFAPNHKGEDMLMPKQNNNWVHQITLTRNIKPSLVTSYLFGGLNYQIEHHLFPSMSRFNYSKARPIVQDFCIKYHLPYKETSWIKSLTEIHQSLKRVAKTWK